MILGGSSALCVGGFRAKQRASRLAMVPELQASSDVACRNGTVGSCGARASGLEGAARLEAATHKVQKSLIRGHASPCS